MMSGSLTNEELAAARCSTKAETPAAATGAGAIVAKSPAAVPSSRHWPPSTESRIVRVSRVFGGKDRHSKVRTVKGLRDRRVRLSVPTAIQLYDLQDRLGLSQPSKVVDWLLDAAQHEIDKLPPLQFPPQQPHDLVAGHHLPTSLVASPFANGAAAADRAAAAANAAAMGGDGDKRHCHGAGIKGLMGLSSNSVGLVNGATMPLAHGLYYTAGEAAWANNGNNNVVHDQLVFYSPEGGGFAMKEAADHQFQVDNLDHSHQGQLSLSSARSFLHPGSQGH
ncbi:unnamed protein product [Urochloa humidicola]